MNVQAILDEKWKNLVTSIAAARHPLERVLSHIPSIGVTLGSFRGVLWKYLYKGFRPYGA